MDGQQTCSCTGKDDRNPLQSRITAYRLQPVFLLHGSHIYSRMGLPTWRVKNTLTVPSFNFTSWWEWVRSHDLEIWDSNTAFAVGLADPKRRGLCCGGRCWTAVKRCNRLLLLCDKARYIGEYTKTNKTIRKFFYKYFSGFWGREKLPNHSVHFQMMKKLHFSKAFLKIVLM